MSRDEIAARLRETFIAELDEQVAAMNADLLALEAEPANRESLQSLFRAAHSLKGAARVARIEVIERANHVIESYLAAVRDGSAEFTDDAFTTLFRAVDALSDAQRRLAAGGALDSAQINDVLDALLALGADASAASAAPRRASGRPNGRESAGAEAAPSAEHDAMRAEATDSSSAIERESAGAAPREQVRVSAERLDELLSAAGELVTARARWSDRLHELDRLRADVAALSRNGGRRTAPSRGEHGGRRDAAIGDALDRLARDSSRLTRDAAIDRLVLDRASDEVLTAVRALRMRPFIDACAGLARSVRDLARAAGKQAELVIEGGEVEADRVVIDALREPLLHLVRNAVDHGIERPSERAARGKPEAGVVRVAAELSGGRLCVTVSDDGGGIDIDALRRRAIEQGRPPPRDESDAVRMLFRGGLTSRRAATRTSGRGVGLDAVRAAMERLGGSVDVDWREGAGTTFTLETPRTPALMRVLLVGVGGQAFAMPAAQIERLLFARPDQLRAGDGRPVLLAAGRAVPAASLAALLGPPFIERTQESAAPAVVVCIGKRRLALLVDELIDEAEIIVQPVPPKAGASPLIGGGAVLPSGRIALMLNAGALLDATGAAGASAIRIEPERRAQPRRHRVLVVDDSITTRTLEQSVLEAAGYEVATAVDGLDGWERLQREPVDLVVADVEMPRVDGFDLCRRVRAEPRLRGTPVVLVTALESPEHRARGLEAGADAYVFKSSFDQEELLETIRQLLD